MRVSSIVLIAACLFASPASADPAQVLATKASFAGGSVGGQVVCNASCLKFEVREGEQYLHLVMSSGATGSVTVDVKTAAGSVRVCQSTKVIGALPIEGLLAVTIVPVLDDTRCGSGPAATGTVIALFSNRDLSLEDAMAIMQADQSRQVAGGLPV